jgi:hypothetical protein
MLTHLPAGPRFKFDQPAAVAQAPRLIRHDAHAEPAADQFEDCQKLIHFALRHEPHARALLHAEMLKSRPPEDGSPKEFLDYVLKVLAGTFDIWARVASRNVVLIDQAADLFEQILSELEPAIAAMASGFAAPGQFPRSSENWEVSVIAPICAVAQTASSPRARDIRSNGVWLPRSGVGSQSLREYSSGVAEDKRAPTRHQKTNVPHL